MVPIWVSRQRLPLADPLVVGAGIADGAGGIFLFAGLELLGPVPVALSPENLAGGAVLLASVAWLGLGARRGEPGGQAAGARRAAGRGPVGL